MSQAQLGAKPPQKLRAIDFGGYGPVVQWYEGQPDRAPDDAAESIVRREAAAYLGRREETERLLAATEALVGDVAAVGETGNLARRREAVALEHELQNDPAAKIADRLERLLDLAKAADDIAVEVRARNLFARLALFECDWIGALARSKELIDLASSTRNEFTLGRALVHRGNALRELSRPEEAEVELREALRNLEETENLRYRAHAELALAGVCVATGRIEEACDLLEHSERTLVDLGIASEAQLARNAAAWAMFAAGRYDDAREKALALVAIDRATEQPRAEMFGLKLLCCIAAASGDVDEAARAADELARLAQITRNATDRFEAKLLQARVQARRDGADAVEALTALVEEARTFDGAALLTALAKIYLAEALLSFDPIAAEAAVEEAREAAPLAGPWAMAELAALERNRAAQPVLVEGGRVIFNFTGELPLREQAQNVLDRALIAAALERTRGNYAKAGRLIGEKRWNMRFISIQKVGAPKHKTPRRAAAAIRKMKKRTE